MTNEDYSKVPPPHLLKKFSEQAREDSQKRGHPGYCKTFAKLCIDWAFQEAAMDDLRVASAEVSGVELNSKSSPNNLQIRSSDLDVTIALVQQWTDEVYGGTGAFASSDDVCLATRAAQWGADQQLAKDAEWLDHNALNEPHLRITPVGESLKEAMRPKPPSLKEQALEGLTRLVSTGEFFSNQMKDLDTIRRALEALPDA